MRDARSARQALADGIELLDAAIADAQFPAFRAMPDGDRQAEIALECLFESRDVSLAFDLFVILTPALLLAARLTLCNLFGVAHGQAAFDDFTGRCRRIFDRQQRARMAGREAAIGQTRLDVVRKLEQP